MQNPQSNSGQLVSSDTITYFLLSTGIRISQEERAAWHKAVHVRFQKKAWFDDELCEEYARVEVKEITREARAAGRE
eukprot:5586103-Prymnesium_polylepis.1